MKIICKISSFIHSFILSWDNMRECLWEFSGRFIATCQQNDRHHVWGWRHVGCCNYFIIKNHKGLIAMSLVPSIPLRPPSSCYQLLCYSSSSSTTTSIWHSPLFLFVFLQFYLPSTLTFSISRWSRREDWNYQLIFIVNNLYSYH